MLMMMMTTMMLMMMVDGEVVDVSIIAISVLICLLFLRSWPAFVPVLSLESDDSSVCFLWSCQLPRKCASRTG